MKKLIMLSLLILSGVGYAQKNSLSLDKSFSLNQKGALELAEQANIEAEKLDKKVSIAVLNNSGVVVLLLKGDGVGPHNTEASRRKAYTALSTKTPSFILMKKAESSETAKNLNTLPELLLLGGGAPIWSNGELVGSIGISGGGSGENDHAIAQRAIQKMGYSLKK
ncbi:heme-binding protein [Ornithobacterium rhinotracheale]|uniref:Uncharacterized protein, possibly involved in utilization of glycolate and propanediol n=1 Tax=Ornithobacterium rhinotracheale (strain ATCC 51463 / DSM 15997 / CCUG 23171 / CIP 104009 / LMG 9086) TaxID=867902 RepID=I4A314_ORNRL|nr:heme-binding protein [Ornithobacterium rhinotracheale]AFL98348.1 uncharacterized protein, possibly involved in utilization of glycolate and propanediol [Ornithobacterium rhinotracheale DSM 15997]AIQ00114.1 hypothetical protein Q785_11215 [Ornithobacterium rhinotracheale ORT-UMN 88]KGB65723.1 hypothetical protein Q787_10740 [Ornithobacterium rhinotracheale H06-030791]MBN3662792.1 heme-binding protein [Ornithobacterium rhinotracheale]MCK0193305.1 heme-binding protein [Ornithobacterium rhinotr